MRFWNRFALARARTAILATTGVAVVMLIVGSVFGSVAFPITKTQTITLRPPFSVSLITTVTITMIQVIQVVNIQQPSQYTVSIWTNNSATTPSSPIISEVSLLANETPPPHVIQFFVRTPSFIFAAPSYQIVPNSNATVFVFSFPNGTRIPAILDKSQNALVTNLTVSGYVQIESWFP